MNCVFKTLQALSANKALSNPTQILTCKLEYYKALSISVKPVRKGNIGRETPTRLAALAHSRR